MCVSRIEADKCRQAAATARGLGTRSPSAGMQPDAAPVFAADRFRRMLRNTSVESLLGSALAHPLLLPVQAEWVDPVQAQGFTEGDPGEATLHIPGDDQQPVVPHDLPSLGQQTLAVPLSGRLQTPSQSTTREGEPPPVDADPGESLLHSAGLASSLAKDTARLVSSLFNRTERTFQTWTVTVPLDPAALPQSEVQLQVSPFRLVLRFRTQSAASAHLISSFKGQLLALLENTRSLPSTIDLELE